MVQVLIFIGGAIVGYGICKLSDVFKDKQNSHPTTSQPIVSTYRHNDNGATQAQNCTSPDVIDISSLAPMMDRYGIDPSSDNSIYLLCSKIKTDTFKKLLDDIVKNTSNGDELLSYLDNVNIDRFTFPKDLKLSGKYFISKNSIDQLIVEYGIKNCNLDEYGKIETAINMAYASAIERLKKNFGGEISRLIKAHESHSDLTSYYNDLINEVQVSRDFLNN